MRNDITALMATMKAAAEKATPGRIGDRIDGSGSIKYECRGYDGSLVLRTDHKNMEYGFVGDNGTADEEFFRACVPDNILALVEALEKAQSKATQQGNIACELFDEVTQLRRSADDKAPELRAQLIEADSELEVLRQRIAELEKAATEPVAWTDEQELRDVERNGCGYLFTVNPVTPHADPLRVIKLYTMPPALESRTVTVKLPDINEYLAEVHDKTLALALRRLAEGVRAGDTAEMTAAGIQVIEGE